MTPADFASGFVDLYRRARELSVPSAKVTRARARTVSSGLEELVAAYIASNSVRNVHIYVDQPVGTGGGRVSYPDLVVLDLTTQNVVALVDVKTDIGWQREGLQSMCTKLAKLRDALLAQGSVRLGPEPRLRISYAISSNLSCHLVIGALANSGRDIQTTDAVQIAANSKVKFHVLIEGKHPNHFSRQQGACFPGLIVMTSSFRALVDTICRTKNCAR